MELEKTYDAKKIESKIQSFWDKNKIYKFRNKGKVYSIDTPPPTVSGKMHMGHVFSYAQQDFVARFRRMVDNVFYPFGTDDNGLPTERLIERLKKVKSENLSRLDFIKLCLKTLSEITPGFVEQWKNLGVSADYDVYYSTIDDQSRQISQRSFIDLYKRGFVYKKEFPTIWCPECQTAIAQAELDDEEETGLFSTLRFKVDGEDLLIATTRPELLAACVAVFVNPADKKNKKFVGKKAKVPLFNFEVPVLEDASADMEKGTGVLMVCSYGDRFDVDAIARHNLIPRLIMNPDGTINVVGYKGLKVKEARKKIIRDLRENNLIKEEKQISHVLNVHDKCGTHVEFIMTEQWFIKILQNKVKLIKQGRKLNWYPDYMYKRYENWVKGLEWDWSISRDRHFGIPIPVWVCKKCDEIILPKLNELPVDPLQIKKRCSKCKQFAEPETKVLDTWATSSLTPQIASSLVKNKIKIPYSLRPQAHDIIRTWAFYTIVKSFYHDKKIPWNDVMISGFVTLHGEKMSKSKGNVIEPEKVLHKFGVDALRFWAGGPKIGEDLDYREEDLIIGKKFITKLWNASRLAFMNLQDYKGKKVKLEMMDRWLLSKLNNVIKESTDSFYKYNPGESKRVVEYFFWSVFCDNYLEIVKDRLYNPKIRGKRARESAQYTLYISLLTVLKLMAPIVPHVTEEIYQKGFRKREKDKSIHISKWPKYDKRMFDKKIEKIGDDVVHIVSKVRQFKAKNNQSLKVPVVLTLEKRYKKEFKDVMEDLKATLNAKKVNFGSSFNVRF